MCFDLFQKSISIVHIVKNLPKHNYKILFPITKLVIFGHSHKPLIQQSGNKLYFNPGSAGPKRFDLPITAGLLKLSYYSVKAEIVSLIDH